MFLGSTYFCFSAFPNSFDFLLYHEYVTMPHRSAKRKAKAVSIRQTAMKRWSDDPQPSTSSAAADGEEAPDFSPPHSKHVTSASYRQSLLPEEIREAFQTNDGAMAGISLLRLKTLLSFVKCEHGNQK